MADLTDIVLLYATFPNLEAASASARRIVAEEKAACINMWPGMRSVYRWQGAVEEAEEVVFVVKTTRARSCEVRDLILETHPYDEPALVEIPVSGGSDSYLDWIRDSTRAG